MQEIVLCKLEEWNPKYKNIDTDEEAVVIYGEPCPELLDMQKQGHCVLAELMHLQELSEEEIAHAICKEEAIQQYANVCICASQLPQGYLRRIYCKTRGIPVLIAETERLIIRESTEEDAEAFYKLYQDVECKKYLSPLPINSTYTDRLESGSDSTAMDQGEPDRDILDKAEVISEYRTYLTDYCANQYGFYEYGMWTVTEKVSGTVVGRMGLELAEHTEGAQKEEERGLETPSTHQEGKELTLSLGYALLPEFRGKGYALEACQAILTYCKECGYAEHVAIRVHADNKSSFRLAKRLGGVQLQKNNNIEKIFWFDIS